MDNADNKNKKPENYVPYDNDDMEYFGASRIIKDEQQYILKRQRLSESTDKQKTDYLNNKLAGLSLSGGGIRSASFCLGVLQALSYNRWLKKMDYLSTVSGGGYIGSSDPKGPLALGTWPTGPATSFHPFGQWKHSHFR